MRKEASLDFSEESIRHNTLNWVIFFVVVFLVFINFFVSMTVLPQFVIEIGGSEFQSGLQNTLFFLSAVVLRIYFGPLADRKGRKIPLLIGSFVFATSPIFFLGSPSVFLLLIARLYQSIGLATFLAAASSLVADLSPEGKTGAYLGIHRVIITISLLVGPSLALNVINSAGYDAWFYLSIAIGLLSFLLMMLVKTVKVSSNEESGAWSNFLAIFNNKAVWKPLAFIALASVSYGAILTFAVVYVSAAANITNPGIFFVYFGLGGIIANSTTGYLSDIYGRRKVLWPLLMILGFGNILFFLLSYSPIFLIASSLITGMGVAGGLLVLIAWLVDVVDKNNRATALSIQESTIDTAIALGAFVVAVASGIIGLAASFLILGILIFALSFMAYCQE